MAEARVKHFNYIYLPTTGSNRIDKPIRYDAEKGRQ